MLIAVEAGRSQFGYVHLIGLQGQRTHRWQRVTASARNVTYAPDGETMAFVCADGGLWFYSFRHDRWRYANDHRVDTLTALFSSDGKLFASSDRQGSLIVRELPD